MLVLTRKIGEKLVFPGLDIEVQVVGMKNNGTVRLGIVAPKEVLVKRGEIKPLDQPPVVIK